MRRILTAAAFLLLCVLFLTGCRTNLTDNPDGTAAPDGNQGAETGQQETSQTEEPPSASPRFVLAEFGAPITYQGRFPVDEAASAELNRQIPLDRAALESRAVDRVPDNRPIVWLQTEDGRQACVYRDNGQCLLEWDGLLCDGTDLVDVDALCAFLEEAQLEAVLADFPGVTELALEQFDYYDDPENTSRRSGVELDEAQSREVLALLQTDRWSVADMFTAQELSRGWADILSLRYNGELYGKVTSGEVAGEMRTVIFYYIGGDADQCANLLAPAEVFDDLYAYIGSG